MTLRPNGDIVFVYIEVQPVLTTAALYDHEPVAGISDAFLLKGSELHLYNKINIDNIDINTRTVAVFKALPTCISQPSCSTCAALSAASNFTCYWCETAGHCSDGADRKRESWDLNQCHLENSTTCESPRGGHTEWRTSSLERGEGEQAATSTIVSIVISIIAIIMLLAMGVAFLYLYGACLHPSKPDGREWGLFAGLSKCPAKGTLRKHHFVSTSFRFFPRWILENICEWKVMVQQTDLILIQ